MAPTFPGSSAYLNGQRRVMCEMSDFDQTINGKQPVDLQHMQAATAWQMALGVTDFNLYYTPSYGKQFPYRQEAQYKEYCNFVGRVNSLLKEANPIRKTLLYYPIYDLQREFIPVAEKISWRTQNQQVATIETSFRQLGTNLLKSQIQFVLADYLYLEKATVTANKTIRLGDAEFTSLVFPKGIILPEHVSKLVEQARLAGVNVVFTDEYKETPAPEDLLKLTGNQPVFSPEGQKIIYGEFLRDVRHIFMVVNTGDEAYSGQIVFQEGNNYTELDPQTGAVSESKKIVNHSVQLSLAPMQTKLFVVM
jgi:hypothetical protein